jgi:hypothetical protein
MHEDLAAGKAQYDARPKGSNGQVLPTEAKGFALITRSRSTLAQPATFERGLAASVRSGIHETGMTQRQFEDGRDWDKGTRFQVSIVIFFREHETKA